MTSARLTELVHDARIPPSAHAAVVQYGNPLHQPIMSSAGNTKMIDDSVPSPTRPSQTILFSTTE